MSAAVSKALSEIQVEVYSKDRHHADCRRLRKIYGCAAPGRVVVDHGRSVEADESRLIGAIKTATARKARELHILIDAVGGRVAAMFRIVAALRDFGGKKRGIIVGHCASASTLILAACDERIAPPRASIIIHAAGYEADDKRLQQHRVTAATLERAAARLSDLDIRMAEILVRRTGSSSFYSMLSDGRDHRLSTSEARDLGLVTKVEPADTAPRSPVSPWMYYRGNFARALASAAAARRVAGTAGPSFAAVRLFGEIGRHRAVSAASVRKQLNMAPYADVLSVAISSLGGCVDEAFRIFAMLLEHPATKKRARIYLDCQSAAVIPLLACDLRSAKAHSTIMIHGVEVNPFDDRGRRWSADIVRQALRGIENSDGAIADLLAARTGFERQWFVDEMRRNRPMRTIDAIKMGIIHEIEGVTSAPTPEWAARRPTSSSAVVGIPSFYFTENYLAACRAAPARGVQKSTAVALSGPVPTLHRQHLKNKY